MLAEKDMKLVLGYLNTAALIVTSEQLARGTVRSGNFHNCLMHYLSYSGKGRFAASGKQAFFAWIQSLADASETNDLELAARRIVRGFDEAHWEENGITLDSPIEKYYQRYPFCYTLTEAKAKQIIDCEILRRARHPIVPRRSNPSESAVLCETC